MTKLTRDQIIATAIELLDAEGMDGLSMRRLGDRLGAGATSLYWHLPSKDELASAAMDHVLADLDLADPAQVGWRSAAESLARGVRGIVTTHPWFVLATMAYPTYGPAAARMADHAIAIFEAAGFTGDDADRAVSALFAYLQGATAGEVAWRARIGNDGVNEQSYTQQVITKGRDAATGYPRLLERYDRHAELTETTVSDPNFEFGLAAVLDGLNTRPR